MPITPINVFKNLNVNQWILVHFQAENGDILHCVPKYKVNEQSISARKRRDQKTLLDPALEKVWGQLTSLTPCLHSL